MEIRRSIIGLFMLLFFFSVGSVAQTILIDGVQTSSISGETCGKKHTLECVLPTNFGSNNDCRWERSDDDGNTWSALPESGQNVYSIDVVNNNGGKQLFHVILQGVGSIVQSFDVSLECNLAICGTDENRLVVWKEDFKSTPRGERKACADVQNRNFEPTKFLNNNMYAIVSHMDDAKGGNSVGFAGGRDHTGNKDGGFLVINNPDGVAYANMLIFQKEIDFDLCPNTWYYFSMYAMCVSRNLQPTDALPNFLFEIIGDDGTSVLASELSGEVPAAPEGISTWLPYGVQFNSGSNTHATLNIYDCAKKGTFGDDMAIDDISLIACEKEVPATILSAGLTPDVDGVCGDSTTLNLSEMSEWESSYPNVYVVWQKSLDGGYSWDIVPSVSGEKSYSLRVPFEESVVGIRYRAVIAKDETTAKFIADNGYSNDACSIYMITNVSTLTCHCVTPEISLSPIDTSFCLIKDDSVSLSVSVTNGVNVDEYHWMYKTDIDAAWTPITTENGPLMKVSPTDLTHYAVCAVNDKCTSDTDSCVVRVIVPDRVFIPLDGKDSICEGGSSVLSLNISPSVKVSWRVKKAGSASFFQLTTEDGPSIEVSPNHGDSYYAISEVDPHICKIVFSDTVSFYVEDSIHIGKKFEDYRVCAGSGVMLSAVSKSASVIGLRWSKRSEDGFEILSETGMTTDTPYVSCEYIVTYIAKTCPSVSDSTWFDVLQADDLKLKISADTICENSTVTLTANYGGATDIVWERMTAGSTSFESFSTDLTGSLEVQPDGETVYRIRTTDDGTCPITYSDSVAVFVEDSIKVKVEPALVEVIKGELINLRADITGDVKLYEWKKRIGFNEETKSYDLGVSDISDVDCEYTFEAKGTVCPDARISVPVTILHPQELLLSISTDTICLGGEATLKTGFSNVSDIVWLAKADIADDFTEITEFSLDPKSTNKVSPTTTTQYKIRERGKDNYSNVVTLYVVQPVELDLIGPGIICPGNEVSLDYLVSDLSQVVEVALQESNADTTAEQILSSDYISTSYTQLLIAPKQETEYTIKVNTKYCPENRMSYTVKVYDVPKNFTLEVSADTICYGDSLIIKTDFPLSEGKAQLEIWHPGETEMAGEGGIFRTNTIVVYPDPGDFRYQLLTRTNEGCLADTLWQKVHVSAPIEDVTSDTVACEGIPLDLAVQVAALGSQYTWSSSADCSDLLGTGETFSFTPMSDTTLYVKVKNEACEKVLEQKVTLFNPPKIQLIGDDVICPDNAVNLYGEVSSLDGISEVAFREFVDGILVGDTTLWNSSMRMNQNIAYYHLSRSPKQETEYSLVVVPKQCAAMQVSLNVTPADKEPDYTFTASADSVCPGNPVTLTALFPNEPESMALYSYYPGNYGEAKEIVEKCTNPVDVYPDGELEYRLVPTYSNGCLGEAHTLSVHMLEPVTGEPWDTTVCEGQSAVLRVRASGTGENYIWSSNADFTDTIGTGDKLNIIPSEEKTYYVKLVDGKCASVMEERVHVVSAPEIGLTGEDKVCPGAELTLQYSVSSLTDLSRIFMRKSMSGSVVDEFELWNGSVMGEDWYAGDYTDGPSREMEYTLVVVPNHCPAIDTSIVVGIAEVPTGFTFTASADSICLGDSVLLSTDFPFSEGNLKLDVWHPEDVDYPAESGVMEAGSEYNYPYDDFRYDLIARTEEGCYADTLSLTIRVSQPMEFTLADTTVCEGETVQLRVHATEPETRYVWSASVDFSDTLGFGDRISVSPTADAEYYVKAVNGKCEKTSQLAVHIAPNPSIELETEGRSAICNGVGGSGDYLYDLGDGFSSVNKLDFVVPSMSYTFTVKDGWGCLADTTFSMVYDELTIPEYFTPQSDGVHDRWEIVNLDKYQQVKVSIYDRFGKKLFETNDPEFSWDGTYNGNPLPSEDYWYAIYVKDIDRFFKGHFTLIRSK